MEVAFFIVHFTLRTMDSYVSTYLDESASQGKSLAEATTLFASAREYTQARDACMHIFDGSESGNITLEAVSHCNVSGLAVQGAWRLFHRVIPGSMLPNGEDREHLYPPDHNRFIGFIEGRCQLTVPEWWRRMISSADENHPDRTGLRTGVWEKLGETGLLTADSTLSICVGEKCHRIAAGILSDAEHGLSPVEYIASTHGNTLAVVTRQSMRTHQRLVCIDLSTNEVRCDSVLWGIGGGLFLSSGSAYTMDDIVSIHIDDRQVAVFGANCKRVATTGGVRFRDSVLYFEAFGITDGVALVRFATNTWDSLDPRSLSVPE
jgi:hypothetical protein